MFYWGRKSQKHHVDVARRVERLETWFVTALLTVIGVLITVLGGILIAVLAD